MFLRPDGPQRDAIPNVWVRVGVGVPLGLGFGLADPFVRTNEPAVTCGQVTTNRWTVTSSTFVVGIAFFGIVTGNREWHSSPLNSHCKPRHRRRRLGYGARVACPPTKKREKYSSGNYRAKVGKFVNFFDKNKNPAF